MRKLFTPGGFLTQGLVYGLFSVLALGLDMLVYLKLAEGGMRAAIAGAIGYSAGLGLHYLLSSRFVFDRSATGKREGHLFAGFALSGGVGLLVTSGVIAALADGLGATPLIAKALAVLASFFVTFLLRRQVVFAKKRAV